MTSESVEQNDVTEKSDEEESQLHIYSKKGLRDSLLWNVIKVDGHEIRAMLDTGAERNFIRENVVTRLGMVDLVEPNIE